MWNRDCAISEADAVLAAKTGTIDAIRIVKSGAEYYVVFRLSWRKEDLFLATTRSTKGPRMFAHLGRLVEYIERSFPGVSSVTLELQK